MLKIWSVLIKKSWLISWPYRTIWATSKLEIHYKEKKPLQREEKRFRRDPAFVRRVLESKILKIIKKLAEDGRGRTYLKNRQLQIIFRAWKHPNNCSKTNHLFLNFMVETYLNTQHYSPNLLKCVLVIKKIKPLQICVMNLSSDLNCD